MTIKGYSDPEAGQACARALELCRQLGETPRLFPALWGVWMFSVNRAEHKTAHELAEQCFSLAQSVQNPALLLMAHLGLGITLHDLGELAPALSHLEQCITLCDPQKRSGRALGDPGVVARCYAAYDLWLLGYPDQALERSHAALT